MHRSVQNPLRSVGDGFRRRSVLGIVSEKTDEPTTKAPGKNWSRSQPRNREPVFEPLFDLYMEFFNLEEGEGSVSAHPKTVQEAAVFRLKTFFFEYKQSNLPRGPIRAFISCY